MNKDNQLSMVFSLFCHTVPKVKEKGCISGSGSSLCRSISDIDLHVV